jgi:hypothetical protein
MYVAHPGNFVPLSGLLSRGVLGAPYNSRQRYLTGLLSRGVLGAAYNSRTRYLTGLGQDGTDPSFDLPIVDSSPIIPTYSGPTDPTAPTNPDTISLPSGVTIPGSTIITLPFPNVPQSNAAPTIIPNTAAVAAAIAMKPPTVTSAPVSIATLLPSGATVPAAPAASLSTFLASSLIPGVTNQNLLIYGGVGLLAVMLLKNKKKKKR